MSWTTDRGRGSFPQAIKTWALRVYRNRCYLCGRPGPGLEFDHITPWFEGGRDTRENCAPICPECHHKKSERERVRAYRKRQAKAKRPAEAHPSEGLKPS